MILSFKQKFENGVPTYFILKIWNSLSNGAPVESDFYNHLVSEYRKFAYEYLNRFNRWWEGIQIIHLPKHHSIREDKHNRWKVGMKIHFYVGSRTKNAFQFAPVVECTGVQKIEIKYTLSNSKIGSFECVSVFIDERRLGYTEIETLAKNDGFNSFNHFISWFNKDFTGKIIHWTNLRY